MLVCGALQICAGAEAACRKEWRMATVFTAYGICSILLAWSK